jgi:hypothetical protein
MGDPLVYIDTSTIGPGMLGSVETALRDLVAFIEANEPQLVAYGAYIDGDGTRMTVFHVHADSASLEFHLEVAGPAFRPFVDLVRLSSIQIYGAPSERAMDQLREKARLLGAGDVVVHPPLAGFFRTQQPTDTNRTERA